MPRHFVGCERPIISLLRLYNGNIVNSTLTRVVSDVRRIRGSRDGICVYSSKKASKSDLGLKYQGVRNCQPPRFSNASLAPSNLRVWASQISRPCNVQYEIQTKDSGAV